MYSETNIIFWFVDKISYIFIIFWWDNFCVIVNSVFILEIKSFSIINDLSINFKAYLTDDFSAK